MYKEDYNEEPVYYCANCYSLRIIRNTYLGMDCCDECGCMDINTTTIDAWEELYRGRYGKDFVHKLADPKRTRLRKMSFPELKDLLWKSEQWYDIIHFVYEEFPKLNRVDSILLFADVVIKDRRVRAFKEALYQYTE